MTYKPSGPNDSTLPPPLVERGEEEEVEVEKMGGRKWVVVYGVVWDELHQGVRGWDSSWTLEGLSEAMDPRGREGKGCNTCTWHGQCIRYPTNA